MTEIEQRKVQRRREYRKDWMQNRRADFYRDGLTSDGKPRKYHRAFHNRAENNDAHHWTQQERERREQLRKQARECQQRRRKRFYARGLNADGKPRQRKPRQTTIIAKWQSFRSTIPALISFEDIGARRDQLAYNFR